MNYDSNKREFENKIEELRKMLDEHGSYDVFDLKDGAEALIEEYDKYFKYSIEALYSEHLSQRDMIADLEEQKTKLEAEIEGLEQSLKDVQRTLDDIEH